MRLHPYQNIAGCITLAVGLLILADNASGTSYYVSSGGNDALAGTSLTTAWKSIDRANTLGIAAPGDTINILPGNYARNLSIELTTSGTTLAPIVYRKFGRGQVVIDMNGAGHQAIIVKSSYTHILGLTITNGGDHGIELIGHYNHVLDCYIHNVSKFGLRISGDYCVAAKNIIANTNDDAIKIESSGDYAQVYNNTLYDARNEGIDISSHTSRFINNIVTLCNSGIKAASGNVLAYNNSWGNVKNYDGVLDSAGGKSVQPQFVDPTTGRFDLRSTDAGINAGINVGLPFVGSAPDIGAVEKYRVYYVGPSGYDFNDGQTALSSWRTVDKSTAPLYPGDTVVLLAGQYTDSISIVSSGLPDDRIVFQGLGDSTHVSVSGLLRAVTISGDNVLWSQTAVSGALNSNIQITGHGVEIADCAISNSSSYGVTITSATQTRLYRNRLFNNDVADVLLAGDSATVAHCTFYSTRYSIDALGSARQTFVNNIFLGASGANTAIRTGSTSTVSFSTVNNFLQPVEGGISLGAGCLTSDPQLVSPVAGNFHPGSSSPAIDAGTTLGVGYVGVAPDMGAYETQALASLTIAPNPSSIPADSQVQFDVIALGADGNPAAPGVLSWSHTFGSGSISPSGLFVPALTGSGTVTVQSSPVVISASTNTFTIVPGRLAHLEISAPTDTISADSTLQLSLSGADVNGNAVVLNGQVAWLVTNGIGTIDSIGLFTAQRVGTGLFKATLDGVQGTSDTVTVIPGLPVILQALPETNIVQTLQQYQYTAITLDADSNQVAEVTSSASWSTTGSGSINGSGLYTAGLIPGNYTIRAAWGGLADTVDVSVVLSGGLSSIRIERQDGSPVNDTTLTTDQDFTRFYARGYDGSGDLIGDVVVSWQVIGADSIGLISNASAASTMLSLRRIGTGRIVAVHGSGLRDSTGIITCLPGTMTSLTISPFADTVVSDSTLQFSVTAFDADRNVTSLAGQPSWQVRGQIGSISAGGLFTPSLVGSGAVICAASGVADTATPIVVLPGVLHHIVVSPDQLVLSADSTRQFTVVGYDAKGNARSAGGITWSLTQPSGSMAASGMYTPSTSGTTRVVAQSALGPVDTSGNITVVPGRLTQISILPDSLSITVDDHVDFSVNGSDSHGNQVVPTSLEWRSLTGIGQVNSQGHYVPLSAGLDSVVVVDPLSGRADTTSHIIIGPGRLRQLVIAPDDSTLRLGDVVQCSAFGFDVAFGTTPVGVITWSVKGGIGSIDSTGLFSSTQAGYGQIIAVSSIDGIADTSNIYTVEALQVAASPIGAILANPGSLDVPLLVARFINPFIRDKMLDRLVLMHNHHGRGSAAQLLTNLDSLAVYLDTDSSLSFTPNDSLLSVYPVAADSQVVTLVNVSVPGNTTRSIVVTGFLSSMATDADTLDLYLSPADCKTIDSTPVTGPPAVNSSGQVVMDGLISSQLAIQSVGHTTVSPSDTLVPVFSLRLPRNGYATDTLRSFRLVDALQADPAIFDSLLLFADNGNGSWDSRSTEQRLGRMVFTGEDYIRTGMQLPLTLPYTTVFVAAAINRFPINGTRCAFGVPLFGVDVRSGNDGPIDIAVLPVDTLTVLTAESLLVETLPLVARTMRPAIIGGPLVSIRLHNDAANDARLDSLQYELELSDPKGGSAAQLLSQLDSVYVYLENTATYQTIDLGDQLLASAAVGSASAWLDLSDITIARYGGSATISVYARLNDTTARNGANIAARIPAKSSIGLTNGPTIGGTFPVRASVPATIDLFPASFVTIDSGNSRQLRAGQLNQPVLTFSISRNGFASDSLRSLGLVNQGTLPEPQAISSLRLWRDLTGDGYSLDDAPVGQFQFSNGEWRLNEIFSPLLRIRNHFVVTASIANEQFDGGTLRLEIPQNGITYWSGTTGPDDAAVSSIAAHAILPSNRITVISVPAGTSSVMPGERNRQLLIFALYNGYRGQTKTLTKLTLTDLSRSQQSGAFRDAALGTVQLLLDANANRIADQDSLVASGTFTDGALRLSGLDLSLAPESLTYCFVLTDIPVSSSDGDSLAMGIASASDFEFSEVATLNGDLPLSSGGYLVIDGSVKAQYGILPVAGGTLQPADSSAVVFAFRPARNGSLVDTLNALTVVNQLDADTSDIANLSLWSDDDADGNVSVSDQRLADFVYQGGQWTASAIDLPILGVAPTLLVVATIDSNASPNALLRLAVPINGCAVASGDDGPRDSALVCPQTYTLSNSRLAVRAHVTQTSFTVGQSWACSYTVVNRLANPIQSVVGIRTNVSDSTLVHVDSSSVGPVDIAADDSVAMTYYVTGIAPGLISWQFRAGNPAGDSSAIINTMPISIQSQASGVKISLVSTVPTAVSRGQANVFPMTLKFEHLNDAAGTAPLRIDSVRLGFEDLSGTAINADLLFRRLVLSTGFDNRVVMDTVPSQSSLWFSFPRQIVLQPGETRNLLLQTDIADNAAANGFRVVVEDTSSLQVTDYNSMVSMPVLATAPYPLRTSLCRINDPSPYLLVSASSLMRTTVNLGQQNVEALRVHFRHFGTAQSSSVQLASITLGVVDSLGQPLWPSDVVSSLAIQRGSLQLGERSNFSGDSLAIGILLSSPLNLSPGQVDSVTIVADILPNAASGGFRVVVADSTSIVLRDLNTGDILTALTDTSKLATGSAFPMVSDFGRLLLASVAPDVCIDLNLPDQIAAGTDTVPLGQFIVTNLGALNHSPIAVREFNLTITDSTGRPIDIARSFDRIGYRIDTRAVEYVAISPEAVLGSMSIPLRDSGELLTAGQTLQVQIIGDVEAAPQERFLVVRASSENCIAMYDYSDDSSLRPATGGSCSNVFPMYSEIAEIFAPAGKPSLEVSQGGVILARPGDSGLKLMRLALHYNGSAFQGSVELTGLQFALQRRTAIGVVDMPAHTIILGAHALINGDTVSGVTTIVQDSLFATLASPFMIASGTSTEITLLVDIKPDAPLGNYRLVLADSSGIVLRDKQLQTSIYGSLMSAIPAYGTEFSLITAGFGESCTNYPNPFIPSRGQQTTIGFALAEDAHVDIELFTVSGDLVKEITEHSWRTSGVHNDDTWDGLNALNRAVVPGTYLCRITANYVSGKTESHVRKVTVIR